MVGGKDCLQKLWQVLVAVGHVDTGSDKGSEYLNTAEIDSASR